MKPISRSGLAALIDLGLSDDSIARFFATDVATVVERRKRYRLGQSADTQYLAPRESIAKMREQARRLIAESRHSVGPSRRRAAAEWAFGLAQFAECEERRLSDLVATAAHAAAADVSGEETDSATLLEKAGAMRTPSARDAYSRLARTYDQLAATLETRAQTPARKERTG